MHWITDVYHACKFTYSNVHILRKTCDLWILSGKSCRYGAGWFSLRKDQDQMNIDSFASKKKFKRFST
ncbi:putative DNA-directed RNA polymerase [Lupinus albus]|uniref:Putative DNA-directed RNA polymerase n=1 Tax=Lupinus albus TaxID=3870 RepID=A0A6A4PHZ6_LUPAL|nr:putative DNA-directed RNA polymerase [Lupinus albus]